MKCPKCKNEIHYKTKICNIVEQIFKNINQKNIPWVCQIMNHYKTIYH